MKIGITYDLRQDYIAAGYSEEETAEFDRPETVEAIQRALQRLGHVTDRVGNVRNLASRLVAGERWELLFNIAEGLRGFSREAQVPAILEAYDIPYTFSDPLALSLTLHKGFAKRVVRDLGLPTPDFAIVETESDIGKIGLEFPLFVKPVAEGSGKGISSASKVSSRRELRYMCQQVMTRCQQPALIETFLPGRELTVGLLGTGNDAAAVGVLEVILSQDAEQNAYSYLNKEKCETLVEYRLATDAVAEEASLVALAAWRGLGCRDAGRVDLRLDAKGIPNFVEANPLPGLHPEHSDLPILCSLVGLRYQDLIGRIIDSAGSRAASAKQRGRPLTAAGIRQ